MIKNSENKFTFKNYLKYLRKYWVLIVVFAVIGLIGSYIYISNSIGSDILFSLNKLLDAIDKLFLN